MKNDYLERMKQAFEVYSTMSNWIPDSEYEEVYIKFGCISGQIQPELPKYAYKINVYY